MLQVVEKWAIPQEEEIGETPQMVETGVLSLVAGTGASQVQETQVTLLVERRETPPVEKKLMIRVGVKEETPQAVERGVTLQAAGTSMMPQVVGMQVTPQVAGTGVRPQVAGMWVILQVVGTGATPQVGVAVASPHVVGPPTGAQLGPLLSLVVWLHIAGAPVPWVA